MITNIDHDNIRQRLADRIREVASHIYANADRIAEQPDYLTSMSIMIDLSPDRAPGYSIDTDHIVDHTYHLEEVLE